MPSSKRPSPSTKSQTTKTSSKTTTETGRETTTTKSRQHDALDVLSLEQVLRELGHDHAASMLDTALEKAITRQVGPSALLDKLMREQLRTAREDRARRALKRSAIFPVTSLDTYDFEHPKHLDRELVLRAASLNFIEQRTNCVLMGPSGLGKTHIANAIGQLACLRG